MNLDDEDRTLRHTRALEGALLILVDRLAIRGSISVDEGVDILQILSRGSTIPGERLKESLNLLSQLQRLRGGDGTLAPGAPASS